MDLKTAVVCFFDAYPPRSGAGNVSWDFFESVKNRKKFFQLSDQNIKKGKFQVQIFFTTNHYLKFYFCLFLYLKYLIF